ncbi:MAG: ArdC-like ssDNA-binding domain-containing protein [Dermatophilaceae bacterium]
MAGEERTKQMLADLHTAVQAIVDSGQLQRWLDAMASNGLHRWSLNNQVLALMQLAQRGEPLGQAHLMGFRQWQQLERHVISGQKAIWILAPMTRKIREEDDNGGTREKTIVTGFKSVPVFNVTQTAGAPLPRAPIRPAAGEATPGTLDGLRDRVAAAGYQYEETIIPDCDPETGHGTQGYTEPKTKKIVVDQRLSGAQKASVIAHDLLTAPTGLN